MQKLCSRCVMDSTVPDIFFNNDGVCNYCESFLQKYQQTFVERRRSSTRALELFLNQVKKDGVGKEYDCVVGLSGGVDSAWVLYQASKFGLRCLAVHMDNGWNSELAQNNIEKLIRSLKVDLYTHVINWNEYKELMLAFFEADVVDIELLYDNAMFAVNYRLAAKYGIRWILAGTNQSTEGMRMPNGWNWFKFDVKNIKSIARKRGVKSFKTFPDLGVLKYVWYEYVRKIHWISFLDLLDYKKEDALKLLEIECQFKRYPYKHYESVFTRFYQGFILPEKFGIDKRKVHLSTLIVTGQLTRDEAIESLSKIPYPSIKNLNEDREYFLKKMNWSEGDLRDYLLRPGRPHDVYGTELPLWKKLSRIYKFFSGKN